MSTKIYNGIIFKDNDMRTLLDNLILERKAYINKVYSFIKPRVLKGIKDKLHNFRQSLDFIEHIRELFIDNYRLEYIIFPFEDVIYGLSFTCHYSGCPAFPLDYIRYSEFFYFDNTDKPENISTKEWDRRREIWSKILIGEDKDGVPIHNGFYYKIFDKEYFNSVEFYTLLTKERGY